MQEPVGEPAARGPIWAEKLVLFLDDGLVLPGTKYRIGFDGLVGLLVPGAGDALTAAGSLSLFYLAVRRGVPKVVLARMATNVAIDALFGAVPLAGDLFDFAWKANRKNLRLIEREQRVERPRNAVDYLVVGLFGLLTACAVTLPFLLTGLLIAYLWK